MAAIPQGYASLGTPFYPLFGSGVYVGRNPGTSNFTPGQLQPYGGGGGVATNSGVTIQTDGSFISSISAQPTNVLRITGDYGVGYIQGSNIAFSMPFSGNAGIRILPSTNQINVNNLVYVSTINPIGNGGVGTAGQINMTQLASSIKGYGWAQVI